MSHRFHQMLPVLIVVLLAALTFWLRIVSEQTVVNRSAKPAGVPDAIVENLTLTQFGKDGKPQFSVTAERMLHYIENETTHFEKPRFVKRGSDGTPMTVLANTATLSEDAGEANFRGSVTLTRPGSAGQPPLVVRTEYLQVLPERDLVRTDQKISVTEGGTTLTGTGMEMDRKTRQIVLLSQVRGTYDVKKR